MTHHERDNGEPFELSEMFSGQEPPTRPYDRPPAPDGPHGPNHRGGAVRVVAACTALAVAVVAGAYEAKEHHMFDHPAVATAPVIPSAMPSTAESAPPDPSPTTPTHPAVIASPSPSVTPTASPSASPDLAPAPNDSKEATEAFEIAQTFVVGFNAATTPKSVIEEVVAKTRIGGIYLTNTENAVADGFTPQFFDHLSALAGVPITVAMDDEGGEVVRNVFSDLPSAKQMGGMSTTEVKAIAHDAGLQMRADGVTLDLAPVVDQDNGLKNGAISAYDRSFGGTPQNIAAKAGAFVTGLQSADVTAVLKHFPGIGYATPDSDTDAHKAVSSPLADLEKYDLVPYQTEFKTGNVQVVMLSNEYVQGLDASHPASISPKVVEFLRGMGFRGVITTDALDSAAKYDGLSLSQNITAAFKAGVDMPLFDYTNTSSIEQAISSIEQGVPAAQISDSYEAVAGLKARAWYP